MVGCAQSMPWPLRDLVTGQPRAAALMHYLQPCHDVAKDQSILPNTIWFEVGLMKRHHFLAYSSLSIYLNLCQVI